VVASTLIAARPILASIKKARRLVLSHRARGDQAHVVLRGVVGPDLI